MGRYAGDANKRQWALTTVHDLLESVEIKPIAFKSAETKEKYIKVVEAICLQALDGAKNLNIQGFCRDNNISSATFYYWIGLEHTSQIIDKFIDRLVSANKPAVYRDLRSIYKNRPGFASLYHRRYEKWVPEEKHTGTITVVFPFMQNAPGKQVNEAKSDKLPDKTIDDAEYDEINDTPSDSK